MVRPTSDLLPVVLPAGWSGPYAFDLTGGGGSAVYYQSANVRIMVSLDVTDAGARWLHLSISRPDRYPTWDEIREAKNWIIGRERAAYQVLPAESEYVNIHGNTFHLWSPLDGDPFPE